MRAAWLCLLLGACGSSGYGTADGDIVFKETGNSDAPYRNELSIQTSGQAYRLRSRDAPIDGYIQLPADARDVVYQLATDAHFEDLPAEILCGCDGDKIGGVTITLSATVDGHGYQTKTHQDTTPPGLAKLIRVLRCIVGADTEESVNFCIRP